MNYTATVAAKCGLLELDIIAGNDRHAADIAEDFLRERGWEL